MEKPLEIVYHDVEKSPDLDGLIRERAAKLEEFHDHIISCHVYIDKPQSHQETGSSFAVRLEIRIPPEQDIMVKSNPGEGSVHDSVFKVVTDTFEVAYRKVKKLREIQLQDVKKHPQQEANAIVVEVLKEKGYGFLETTDGRKVYFHQNSVSEGRFEDLKPGDSVNFTEKEGEKGPQASTVRLVYRPHL